MNDICINNEDTQLRERIRTRLDVLDVQRLRIIYDVSTSAHLDESYPAVWSRAKYNIAYAKECAWAAAGTSTVAFATALIISTLIIVLLILYPSLCGVMPNAVWRYFVLWVILIALIFVVEMCAAKWYTSN